MTRGLEFLDRGSNQYHGHDHWLFPRCVINKVITHENLKQITIRSYRTYSRKRFQTMLILNLWEFG